jgi:hypothetical protein
MYTCNCGYPRCNKPVSRSTWYRHKLAMVLRNQLDLDSNQIAEPLPVEDAPVQGHEEHQQPDLEQQEVKNPKIS